MYKTIIWICLSILCVSDTFHFGRVLQCVEEKGKSCSRWNDTTLLYHYESFYHYMCFPASTLVLGEEGPIRLDEVETGDKILVFNPETGQSQFQPVVAWMHRDTVGYLEFERIQTEEGWTFLASQTHNIGYLEDGKVGFKFAEALKSGEKLISLGPQLTVKKTDGIKEEQGLYSPITDAANFYIFPHAKDISQAPMTLVHCLSQLSSPLSHQKWIKPFLHASEWLGLNYHENIHEQNYIHPIAHLMKLFHSEKRSTPLHRYSIKINNHESGQKMRHQHENQHEKSSFGRSSSRSSSYFYSGLATGAASDYENRKQTMKRRQQSVVSLLMINEVILR